MAVTWFCATILIYVYVHTVEDSTLISIFDQFRFFRFFQGCQKSTISLYLRLLLVASLLILGYNATHRLISFPSPTHSFIPRLKPSFSANPSHRSLSFSSSELTTWIPQTFTVTSKHIRFYFLVFRFTLFSCRFMCGTLMVKAKVFPYSLPSVGPRVDPGVQAASQQVT